MKNFKLLLFLVIFLIGLLIYIFYFQKEKVIAPSQHPAITHPISGCAKEYEKINRNPLLGSIEKKCCEGLIEWRVSRSFSYCLKPTFGEIIVIEPLTENVFSPFTISGKAKGNWFFEGEFKAELYDNEDNLISSTILTATQDWMKEDFVPFQGKMEFSIGKEKINQWGKLRFLSNNPSGLIENQKVFEVPIRFVENKSKAILLYFYNPNQDKDLNGNIKCSKEGLIPIERNIPFSSTPIKDALKILILKGKEILTEEEKKEGITTEFPLEGFDLKSINLKNDGTLILEFNDPLNKSVGGACRVGILWFQIEETAKQFKEVKKVQFLPEYLFQP